MSNEEYNLDRETIVDNLTVFADARADRAKSFAGGDAKIDDTDVRQFFTGLFQAFGTDPDRVATSFDEAERLADRVVILDRGTVVADGAPAVIAAGGRLEDAYFALTGGNRG